MVHLTSRTARFSYDWFPRPAVADAIAHAQYPIPGKAYHVRHCCSDVPMSWCPMLVAQVLSLAKFAKLGGMCRCAHLPVCTERFGLTQATECILLL